MLLTVLLWILVSTAAVLDLRTHRIPNALTVSGVVVALALRSTGGSAELYAGLLGGLIAFVVAAILFAAGAFGGGDAKLLTGVGTILGPQLILAGLLYTVLAGGVLALVVAVRRGLLPQLLFGTGRLALYGMSLGRAGERLSITSPSAVYVPYGVAIAVGALLGWHL
jgi:prepilin peptidase CpaA